MMGFKDVLSWLKSQYDKLIAFVLLLGLLASLLYLAIRIGMMPSIQKQFHDEIEGITPEREHTAAVDPAVFKQTAKNLYETFQIAKWTNLVFVPETRVWCVDCRRPIPYTTEKCPFCGAVQPLDPTDRPNWDGDRDGIWDRWEKKYGLDPFDPDDAKRDNDGDGFSNIEEFRADPQTDPTNADDCPDILVKLYVEKIVADPFKLRFKSVIKLPDGSLKFALNLKKGERTYFVKLGEEVLGFKLHKYEEKFVDMVRPGWTKPRPVDVSELTLKRGDKLITLVKDKDVQYNEYIARLSFSLDHTKHSVKLNDVLELKEKKYEVIDVDIKQERVLLRNLHDGKETTVEKFPENNTEVILEVPVFSKDPMEKFR